MDASYLAHKDAKSHTGYCMSFGRFGSFYAKSVKQKLLATSPAHTEMQALFTLVLDIIFTVHLCKEIRRPIALPAIVFEDNQPVIDLSKALGGKITRSKHFLMLTEFIREQVVSGLIELKKIIFTVHLCKEIRRPIALPAIVFEDNQPVIDLSKTLGGKITQ